MRTWMLLLAAVTSAHAYEVDTHGRMTQTVYERSVLTTDSDLLRRLGFDRLELQKPFRMPWEQTPCLPGIGSPLIDSYPDAAGDWQGQAFDADVYSRCPDSYEKRLMPPEYSGRIGPPPSLGNTPELRIAAWLMRGAIREDDLVSGNYYDPADAPDASPWGEIDRPTHHFYSPVTNTSDGAFTQSALPWALGQADPFAASPAPDPDRDNHFSYADAVRNYDLALRFKRSGPVTRNVSESDARARASLWAGALISLGHTVHLLQDMAQPQHVRGEAHNYLCRGFLSNFNQDVANRTYENFSNFRVAFTYNDQVQRQGGTNLYTATNPCEEQEWMDLFAEAGFTPPPAPTPFTTSSYPIPSFTLARKFFTTRNAGDPTTAAGLGVGINIRAGLADYTNRGFYTQDNGAGDYLSPPSFGSPEMVQGDMAETFVPGLGTLRLRGLYWQVPDVVAPNFADPGRDAQGRAPIASLSYWTFREQTNAQPVLSLANYTQMADMLGPRAIAYSAGLINYFFRGKLDVEVPDMTLIAVLNQGETHSVDVDGYPRRPDQSIFGFTKVRLKVRNATAEIVESGSAAHSVQNASSGQLVAIARYHRNACYQVDLSGQRTQGYSAMPPAPITAPTCTAALPERTDYEEISVSAPIAISGEDALPGMVGTTSPAWVDKVFDFGADPIPVNATDLFIQIVYRGQLGEESDGIAVGRLDVREPTFVAAYNGSDHRWTGTAWTLGSIGTTTRAADFFHLCGGSPTQLLYRNAVPPALRYSVSGSPPDVVRLAIVTTAPAGNRVFRAQPTMIPSPSAEIRIFTTKGAIRQAGREVVSVSTIANDCTSEPVAGTDVWCNTPSQRRRSQILGDVQQAIYYAPIGLNASIDVDAAGLPAYSSLSVRNDGENRFNDDPLINCPSAPALTQEQEELIKLLEEGAGLGLELN